MADGRHARRAHGGLSPRSGGSSSERVAAHGNRICAASRHTMFPAIAGAGNDGFERNRTSVRLEAGSRTPPGSGNRASGRQLRNDPSCRSTTLRNALNSTSPGSPEP